MTDDIRDFDPAPDRPASTATTPVVHDGPSKHAVGDDRAPHPGAATSQAANHHDDVPRAAHLSLNDRFVDRLGEAGLTAYVQALVDAAGVAAAGGDHDAVAERLATSLAGSGIEVSPVQRQQVVDQLRSARGNLHVSAYGKVIYGDPALDSASFEPHVVGTEDPADPERPFYT